MTGASIAGGAPITEGGPVGMAGGDVTGSWTGAEIGAWAGARRLLAGGVTTGSWTGIFALKALANGSIIGAAATATSGSVSKPTNALPKAASNILPPTALPLPSA